MSALTGGDSVEMAARPDGDDSNAGDAALLARDKIVLIFALIDIALVIASILGLAVSASHSSLWWLLPAILAAVYFCSSFLTSFKVFQSNADYLMKLSGSEPPASDGRQLQTQRNEASDALALGVIFAIIMAIVAAFSR
jgi:hypothetical protein